MFEEMNNVINGMLNSGIDTERMGEPLVWGFSMTQRGDEAPEIREFGNVGLRDGLVKEGMFPAGMTEQHPGTQAHPGVRKPLVDILEGEDTLHVVAEMPGVTKEDVSLDCNGTVLDIKANTDERKYAEHVELPARVLPDSAKATYKNGVLEVVFRYDGSDKKSIKVD